MANSVFGFISDKVNDAQEAVNSIYGRAKENEKKYISTLKSYGVPSQTRTDK